MAPEPHGLDLDEPGDVVAFIAAQQAHPDRRITSLGEEADGIAAELEDLTPPWRTTARILRDGAAVRGALVAEWDADLGRAWLHGPWVADEDDAWQAAAAALLDAGLAQLPPAVTRYELAGDPANHRLAVLAASRGLAPAEASHILVADADVVAAWPTDGAGPGRLRPADADDLAAIEALHDATFPATYATAATLVAGQLDGSRILLVIDQVGGGLAGYATGEVHPDGEGYLDFVAVADRARRSGVGRRLVTSITRQLLARSPMGRVALTVEDGRGGARALYRSLGFRPEGTIVPYRSRA